MNRGQREALERIAARLLSERASGRAGVGDNPAIRALHEPGYIEVRQVTERLGGGSAMRLLPGYVPTGDADGRGMGGPERRAASGAVGVPRPQSHVVLLTRLADLPLLSRARLG